jgi:hypothetical protein
MKFLTIQDGDWTINLSHVTSIDWTEGDEEATVYMSNGLEHTCEGRDYYALRQAIGLGGPE